MPSLNFNSKKTGDNIEKRDIFRVAVCGGGTGGHIFPGLSILEAISDSIPIEVMWIGTGREVEKRILKTKEVKYKFEYKWIDARPFYGVELKNLLKGGFLLPLSIIKARGILRAFSPDILLGIGGYVAGPVIIAAYLSRVPVVLHEQNVIPGLTNRLGGRFSKKIFISFKGAERWFPKNKTMLTGNPVREEFLTVGEFKRDFQANGNRPWRILTIGGSQGARAINRLVSASLSILAKSGMKIEAVHQTGKNDMEYAQKIYNDAAIKANVVPFIDNMKDAYLWADLVICRAGAGTCAELSITATPSILIPYPHAASGHQLENAKELQGAGASIVLEESHVGPERLASTIEDTLRSPQRLKAMSVAAKKLARPDAAKIVAEEMIKIMTNKETNKKG